MKVYGKPLHKSVTVWSAAASVAGFVASALPFVPEKFKPYATLIGGIAGAVSALGARRAGVAAAREASAQS